jgi:hypothetical protein
MEFLNDNIGVIILIFLLGIISIIIKGNYFIKRFLLFIASLPVGYFSIMQVAESDNLWWFLLFGISCIACGVAISDNWD